jgi:hypothetical protein
MEGLQKGVYMPESESSAILHVIMCGYGYRNTKDNISSEKTAKSHRVCLLQRVIGNCSD